MCPRTRPRGCCCVALRALRRELDAVLSSSTPAQSHGGVDEANPTAGAPARADRPVRRRDGADTPDEPAAASRRTRRTAEPAPVAGGKARPTSLNDRRMTMSKISPEHLARGAYVYVRQSTADQLRNNHESRRRQYALADRARSLGWTEVVVIDDDLGVSAGGVARPGFERLLAAICGGQVGAVVSIEASRLARNGRDWHTLLEFCALVGSVIVDEDGVYDPRSVNDRLLLGMKGTMSEMELSLLRQRSVEATQAQGRAGRSAHDRGHRLRAQRGRPDRTRRRSAHPRSDRCRVHALRAGRQRAPGAAVVPAGAHRAACGGLRGRAGAAWSGGCRSTTPCSRSSPTRSMPVPMRSAAPRRGCGSKPAASASCAAIVVRRSTGRS